MASILVEDHRDDVAERYLKRLLDSEPQNKKALNNLGNIKRRNNQFDEAISLYKQALCRLSKSSCSLCSKRFVK